ncbi:allergen v5 tpx-1-related protein [Neofusicoccum parvum]|uniref:Allergen v5 tpx-1-related protein n=1 Tax=Neofusicoccum parvum TaxID=310453 RepID=A0ACB5SHC4_9PEZI|nr:allergen v5 tpx-1-related protein [Neofusicoccum parvum]
MRFSTLMIAVLATAAAASPVPQGGWSMIWGNGGSSAPTEETSSSSGSSGNNAGTNTGTGSSGSGTSGGGGNQWVKLHNKYRAKHVDTPPLEWDETLAQTATAHSQKCVFEHSQDNNLGENLAMGTGLTAQQTVQMWYDEIDQYNQYWGKNDVPMDVMHFTQVVWKKTTKVGCGMADCSQGKLATCNYSPAGNMLGTFAANVGRLKSGN